MYYDSIITLYKFKLILFFSFLMETNMIGIALPLGNLTERRTLNTKHISNIKTAAMSILGPMSQIPSDSKFNAKSTDNSFMNI